MAIRHSFVALTVAVLGGCASTPAPFERARPAAAEQVRGLPAVTRPDPATVRIARDEAIYGAAVYHHVSLDGKRIASLNPGEFVEFPVDPGDHVLSVIPTDPLGDRLPSVIESTWRPGVTYRYRTGVDANLRILIFRAPE